VLLSELSIEIRTVSPKGRSLSGRKRELQLEAVYGGGFDATRLRATELITILNRCYRFRGFVYQHAHFSVDKKSLEKEAFQQLWEYNSPTWAASPR